MALQKRYLDKLLKAMLALLNDHPDYTVQEAYGALLTDSIRLDGLHVYVKCNTATNGDTEVVDVTEHVAKLRVVMDYIEVVRSLMELNPHMKLRDVVWSGRDYDNQIQCLKGAIANFVDQEATEFGQDQEEMPATRLTELENLPGEISNLNATLRQAFDPFAHVRTTVGDHTSAFAPIAGIELSDYMRAARLWKAYKDKSISLIVTDEHAFIQFAFAKIDAINTAGGAVSNADALAILDLMDALKALDIPDLDFSLAVVAPPNAFDINTHGVNIDPTRETALWEQVQAAGLAVDPLRSLRPDTPADYKRDLKEALTQVDFLALVDPTDPFDLVPALAPYFENGKHPEDLKNLIKALHTQLTSAESGYEIRFKELEGYSDQRILMPGGTAALSARTNDIRKYAKLLDMCQCACDPEVFKETMGGDPLGKQHINALAAALHPWGELKYRVDGYTDGMHFDVNKPLEQFVEVVSSPGRQQSGLLTGIITESEVTRFNNSVIARIRLGCYELLNDLHTCFDPENANKVTALLGLVEGHRKVGGETNVNPKLKAPSDGVQKSFAVEGEAILRLSALSRQETPLEEGVSALYQLLADLGVDGGNNDTVHWDTYPAQVCDALDITEENDRLSITTLFTKPDFQSAVDQNRIDAGADEKMTGSTSPLLKTASRFLSKPNVVPLEIEMKLNELRYAFLASLIGRPNLSNSVADVQDNLSRLQGQLESKEGLETSDVGGVPVSLKPVSAVDLDLETLVESKNITEEVKNEYESALVSFSSSATTATKIGLQNAASHVIFPINADDSSTTATVNVTQMKKILVDPYVSSASGTTAPEEKYFQEAKDTPDLRELVGGMLDVEGYPDNMDNPQDFKVKASSQPFEDCKSFSITRGTEHGELKFAAHFNKRSIKSRRKKQDIAFVLGMVRCHVLNEGGFNETEKTLAGQLVDAFASHDVGGLLDNIRLVKSTPEGIRIFEDVVSILGTTRIQLDQVGEDWKKDGEVDYERIIQQVFPGLHEHCHSPAETTVSHSDALDGDSKAMLKEWTGYYTSQCTVVPTVRTLTPRGQQRRTKKKELAKLHSDAPKERGLSHLVGSAHVTKEHLEEKSESLIQNERLSRYTTGSLVGLLMVQARIDSNMVELTEDADYKDCIAQFVARYQRDDSFFRSDIPAQEREVARLFRELCGCTTGEITAEEVKTQLEGSLGNELLPVIKEAYLESNAIQGSTPREKRRMRHCKSACARQLVGEHAHTTTLLKLLKTEARDPASLDDFNLNTLPTDELLDRAMRIDSTVPAVIGDVRRNLLTKIARAVNARLLAFQAQLPDAVCGLYGAQGSDVVSLTTAERGAVSVTTALTKEQLREALQLWSLCDMLEKENHHVEDVMHANYKKIVTTMRYAVMAYAEDPIANTHYFSAHALPAPTVDVAQFNATDKVNAALDDLLLAMQRHDVSCPNKYACNTYTNLAVQIEGIHPGATPAPMMHLLRDEHREPFLDACWNQIKTAYQASNEDADVLQTFMKIRTAMHWKPHCNADTPSYYSTLNDDNKILYNKMFKAAVHLSQSILPGVETIMRQEPVKVPPALLAPNHVNQNRSFKPHAVNRLAADRIRMQILNSYLNASDINVKAYIARLIVSLGSPLPRGFQNLADEIMLLQPEKLLILQDELEKVRRQSAEFIAQHSSSPSEAHQATNDRVSDRAEYMGALVQVGVSEFDARFGIMFKYIKGRDGDEAFGAIENNKVLQDHLLGLTDAVALTSTEKNLVTSLSESEWEVLKTNVIKQWGRNNPESENALSLQKPHVGKSDLHRKFQDEAQAQFYKKQGSTNNFNVRTVANGMFLILSTVKERLSNYDQSLLSLEANRWAQICLESIVPVSDFFVWMLDQQTQGNPYAQNCSQKVREFQNGEHSKGRGSQVGRFFSPSAPFSGDFDDQMGDALAAYAYSECPNDLEKAKVKVKELGVRLQYYFWAVTVAEQPDGLWRTMTGSDAAEKDCWGKIADRVWGNEIDSTQSRKPNEMGMRQHMELSISRAEQMLDHVSAQQSTSMATPTDEVWSGLENHNPQPIIVN